MKRSHAITAALVAIYWVTTFFIEPAVEHARRTIPGIINPVVLPATLGQHRPFPPPEYRFIWKAAAYKVRAEEECEYHHLEWWYGRRGYPSQPIQSGFTDPPESRGKGLLEWDGLWISLQPDVVLTNSYAYVYHDCGGKRLVRSLFYDSAMNL